MEVPMKVEGQEQFESESSEVREFSEQVGPHLSYLRAVPRKMAGLVEQAREQLVRIESEPDDIPNARQVEVVREKANEQLSELLLAIYAAQDGVQRVLSRVTQLVDEPAETIEEAILWEIREWRAWQRLVRRLDAGIDLEDVISDVVGDRVALRALRAELPAYLKSRDQGDRVEQALATLREAELQLPPALRALVGAVQEEFESGWYRLRQAIQDTEHELNGNWGAVWEIPDWALDRTIKLRTLADFYRSNHGESNGEARLREASIRRRFSNPPGKSA
jgi:hypothetical protein